MRLTWALCRLHVGEDEFELVEVPLKVGSLAALQLLQISEIEKCGALGVFAVEIVYHPDQLPA